MFPDSKRIVFVAYQNLGYDILYKDISKTDYSKDDRKVTEHIDVSFPKGYFDHTKTQFEKTDFTVTPDDIMLGLFGAGNNQSNIGLYGFGAFSLSDYFGNKKLIFMANYFREGKSDNVNFDLTYLYLKNRMDYGAGIFRRNNPFWIYSISDINNLLYNYDYGAKHMEHYGAYGVMSYPFSRFFRVSTKASMSRYERDYISEVDRTDVFANINQLTVSLHYDNVLWAYMFPADGFRGKVSFSQSVDLSGQDFLFSSIDIDLRQYFLIYKKYIFAFRGIGGYIFGRDDEFFKYYIGGYGTLRGHPFLEYSGTKMFLVNAEYRFIFIEGIKFGWPLFFGIGNIGGVLFVDAGSVWDETYTYKNEDGTLRDLKADAGFGFRLFLYPVVILKLDYAWEYTGKKFDDMNVLFSLGFEY